jgi:hypothetical protein
MAKICVCCGKQAIFEWVPSWDERLTTLQGARAAIKANECYCGHCARDMDEYGLFPEEHQFL